MAALDTNVLVRLLVGDDAGQAAVARAAVRAALRRRAEVLVPLTVVLELEWVLRSRYDYSRSQVLAALGALLEVRDLVFQSEAALENALHYYRGGHADFAECLHLGCAAAEGHLPLLTFDRRAGRMRGVTVLA